MKTEVEQRLDAQGKTIESLGNRLTRAINEIDSELVRQRDSAAATLLDHEKRIVLLEDVQSHQAESWEKCLAELREELGRKIRSEAMGTEKVLVNHEGRLNGLEAPEFDPRDDLRPTVVGDCVVETTARDKGVWQTVVRRNDRCKGLTYYHNPEEWHTLFVQMVRFIQEK